jgi:hypothetical protein
MAMTRSSTLAWALIGAFAVHAHAQKTEKAEKAPAAKTEAAPPAGGGPVAPPKPGAEMKALAPIASNYTWAGTIKAGAMGPGTPEVKSKGKQHCKWIMNGLWAECDIEDTAGEGKAAMKWMGHMDFGWDVENKGYRMVGVDNMGTAYLLNGKAEGPKFVFESAADTLFMGQPIKYRFTFDTTDPKAIKFTDERSMKGGPWMVAEEATFKKAP